MFFFQAWVETCLCPHHSWIMELHNPSSPAPQTGVKGRSGAARSQVGGENRSVPRDVENSSRLDLTGLLISILLPARLSGNRQATPRGNVPDPGLAPQRGFHPASQIKKSPTASCRPGVVHLLRVTKYLSRQLVDVFFCVHILKAVYLLRSDSTCCFNDESNHELTVKHSLFL